MTYEEKYKFLLEFLRISNKDFWEGDALVVMDPIYFTLPYNGKVFTDEDNVDRAIEAAMKDKCTGQK